MKKSEHISRRERKEYINTHEIYMSAAQKSMRLSKSQKADVRDFKCRYNSINEIMYRLLKQEEQVNQKGGNSWQL